MRTSIEDVPDLYERSRPLRELVAALDESRARGMPATVRISGPPGIGKSAFLRRAVETNALGAVLVACAEPGDDASQGSCVRRLLSSHAAVDTGEDGLRAALIAQATRPTTLVIDDSQWIDELSLRVLRTVTHEQPLRFAVVFADRRLEAPNFPKHHSIYLQPLRTQYAKRLIRARFPTAPLAVIKEIVSLSSGIPFALLLLASEAARAGARSREETEPSVRAAIQSRMRRANTDARHAISLAAFLEASADLRTVARAMERDFGSVSDAFAELEDLVTVEESRIVFRHGAIVDAVRAATPDPVPYYSSLLRALDDADTSPSVLAQRFWCARGCGEDAIACDLALRLARALAASSSLETALRYVELGITHAPRPIPTAYSIEYGGLLQQLSRDVEASQFLREQIRDAISRHDDAAAAELLASFFSAALTLELFGELELLVAHVERMASSDTVKRRLHNVKLASLAFDGHLDEFLTLSRGQRGWVDGRPTAFVMALKGEFDAAGSAYDRYRANLGPEHARQEPSDRVFLAALGLRNVGASALLPLEDDQSDTMVMRSYPSAGALRIFRRISAGEWAAVEAGIAAVPIWDPAYHEPYPILDVRLMFAALARRGPDDAPQIVSHLRAMIARRQLRHALSPARWFLIAHGADGAHDIAAFVESTLELAPLPYLTGALPVAITLLEPFLGKTRCASALSAWPAYRSRWDETHLELAWGLFQEDHQRLRRARDHFDELGAAGFAMLAGAALPVPRARDMVLKDALGADEGPSVGLLTSRERDTAELVAQGQTNRQIAATLQISERTVEVHLTNAFRKLAVRSRSALTRALLSRS